MFYSGGGIDLRDLMVMTFKLAKLTSNLQILKFSFALYYLHI